MSEGEKPLKVRHVSKDFKSGETTVREETFGSENIKIEHKTRVKGEPTTITREGSRETESKTRDEDPLGLRRRRS